MHLPASVVFILGVLGGILEIVQQTVITMSGTAHSIVAFSIIVILALGVVPLGASALARLLPAPVAAILTAVAGIIEAAQSTFAMSTGWHDVISLVLTLLATIGIVPAVVSVAVARTEQRAEARQRGLLV